MSVPTTTTTVWQLLPALLSPHAATRHAAEHCLYHSQRWTTEERCVGLLQVLQQQQQQQQQQQPCQQQQQLEQLAAVLLRREIITMRPVAANTTTTTRTSSSSQQQQQQLQQQQWIIESLMDPLLCVLQQQQLLLNLQQQQLQLQQLQLQQLQLQHATSTTTAAAARTTTTTATATAVCHCLAEICAFLLLEMSPTQQHEKKDHNSDNDDAGLAQSVAAVRRMLQAFSTHVPLWIAVAERAPRAYAASGVWQQQLPWPAGSPVSSQQQQQQQQQQWLKLLVVTATAVANSSNNNDSNNNNAVVSQLGQRYLLPMLQQQQQRLYQQQQQQQQPQQHENDNDNDADRVVWLWELLLQAAEDVPALLAACLAAVLECGATANHLHAVHVVATLVSVPSVKLSLLLQSQSQQLERVLPALLSTCWHAMQQQKSSTCDDDDPDDNDDEWAMEPAPLHQNAYVDGDNDDEAAEYAGALLAELLRVSPALALSILLPVLQQAFASCQQQQQQQGNRGNNRNRNWKVHRAALAALQCCVEAVPVAFLPHVAHATQAALHAAAVATPCDDDNNRNTSSSRLRVQYQAVQLIGVLCETSFSTTTTTTTSLRDLYAAQLLEALARASHSPCTKVAAMACQAMVSYCRRTSSSSSFSSHVKDDDGDANAASYVVPYLRDVLQALVTGPLSLELTNTGAVVVQVRAIGAIACFAQVAGPAFAPYYSSVMPGLLACAQIATVGNYEKLQLAGSSLEAAAMVMQAVGDDDCRDLFVADAQQILHWAVPALSLQPAPPLPTDLLLSTCARIASVLGEREYAPFVDRVLPHLLRRATDPADVEFSEGDVPGLDATTRQQLELDEDAGTESMTVRIPGRGLNKVTINTTKIQEKAQAARAVYEHAVALGASFGPYIKPCFDAFLPLVDFKYSSEIRATAAQTLAAVFDSACSYDETTGMDIPRAYLPLVTKAISKQIRDEDAGDMETLYALADSLCGVCRSMYLYVVDHGKALLDNHSQGDVTLVVQCCMKSMVLCLERRSHITGVLADGPMSGEDERNELEALLQSEEDLLTPLVDSVGYSLKCFGTMFVPIFEEDVAPVLGPYLRAGNDMRARLSAICLFDDCVEHCGSAAAAKFGPPLVEGILNGMNDAAQDSELKRAAIYGIAQIARHAPANVLAEHAQYLSQQLCLISSGPKGESENAVIFENAVSALASLVLFDNAPFRNACFVKRETVVQTFLNSLPLREDEDEAKICHSGLCDLIEAASIDASYDSLARIVNETLACVEDGEELASLRTCDRLRAILIRLQQNENGFLQASFGFANVIS